MNRATLISLALAATASSLVAQEVVETAPEKQAQLAPPPADRSAGFATIKPEDCKKWLSVLASDEFGGRATGRPGYEKAAKFVAAHFKSLGLVPMGDDGTYFQKVPYELVAPDAEQCWLAITDASGKEIHRLAFGQGFAGEIASDSDKTFELVIATAKDSEIFGKLGEVGGAPSLEGKAVLFIDRSDARQRGFSRTTMALYRAGPAAVIVIDDDLAAAPADALGRVSYAGPADAQRQPRQRPNRYAISRAVAKTLLEKLGGDLEILDTETDTVAAVSGKVRTHVQMKRQEVFGANVIAKLEGSDSKLKDEYVGIGSHLDHIGTNARGEVNNGADDDGSGTTGVLAVSRAFAENKVRPKRSILFMCFSGEEMGLLGSRYYTENPVVPNEQMVAELQMDMIGRNEEKVDRQTGEVSEAASENLNSLHLVGTKKLSDELHAICLGINEKFVNFDFEYDEEDVFYRSDHANFAKKNIPIAFFFTGFHPQYHRPDDTVEKIDFEKLSRVAKLCYLIGFELADRDARPVVDRTWDEVMKSERGSRRRGR
ncbi:MAG: M20/M25/M40 family metallo-hydrolase [Planctomycetes bacterium]|nr:M20/M25/M40 family metallo-hydrolase [Planctomycetota bacterium]MCB9918548.1 M20/M25/M40 family metallo-hydrolase [Planctomycetota bacterium]